MSSSNLEAPGLLAIFAAGRMILKVAQLMTIMPTAFDHDETSDLRS